MGRAEQLGFGLGLQVDRPRPKYSARLRAVSASGKRAIQSKPPIEPTHSHALARQTGIIIAGGAGQKIRSKATLFAEGSIFAGLCATQKDDYPITVQTGHSVSEIILSPECIDYTGIDSPDFLLVLSKDGPARVRGGIENLHETCVLYSEETLELPTTRARVRRLPFFELLPSDRSSEMVRIEARRGSSMGRKRHTAEQIIRKLREAEVELAKGQTTADVARKLGITEQTYYRWRKEYGGLRLDQAKRLKELEKENARLKKRVADQALDNAILKEFASGNF